MSTPSSIGLQAAAVATVLSQISGTPASWAILARASKSGTALFGFEIVSMYSPRVFSSIRALASSGFVESKNRVSMPNRGSVWLNSVTVPP